MLPDSLWSKAMSNNHWFLLPKHPHLPAPDWRQLERLMLEKQMLLPASGQNIPRCMLVDLSMALAAIPGANYLYDEKWTSAEDVLRTHMAAGHIPTTIQTSPYWSVEDAVQALHAHRIPLGDTWKFSEHTWANWASPRYRVGPGMRQFYDGHDYEIERKRAAITLFTTHGDQSPFVIAGEDTVAPYIPGDDSELEDLQPFGSYTDFINSVCEDIQATWTNPNDGRAYHILELDWSDGLGIGWNFMQFDDGGDLDRDRFAIAIGELIGHPVMFSHRHL